MLNLINDPLLVDLGPAQVAHNERARILRNGLAVSSFSNLETYIERRVEKLAEKLATSALNFGLLDQQLQSFLLVDAVHGLSNRVRFLDQADRQSFVASNVKMISSFDAAPPNFTALGFSPRGSNVFEGDVSSFLNAFGIKKPWRELTRLTTILGSSRIDLKEDFQALGRRRNAAAHNADFNIPSGDLEIHLRNCIVIGSVLDLICVRLSKALDGAANYAMFT